MGVQKLIFSVFLVGAFFGTAFGEDAPFNRYEAGFKNFITCELTRTDARDHFKGSPFSITMINLHDVRREGDIVILTGAVQCFVKDAYHTLYAALGIRTVAEREKVSYYTIRKAEFPILASELIRFPYKERCPWTRYWVDLD